MSSVALLQRLQSEESVLVDRLLPFHLWRPWLFQGIRGLQGESGKHNRLQFLVSPEGLETPSRSWYKKTLLWSARSARYENIQVENWAASD